MTISSLLLALVALQAKHLFFDFLVQTPFMYTNKGRYGHPGGLVHAGLHGIGTLCVLLAFAVGPWIALAVSLAEAVVHYNVDWGKEKINKRLRLTTAKYGFWVLLGADQAIHQFTYVAIVALIASL